MIIVQRVSKRFAAENRGIASADMSGSVYVFPLTRFRGQELTPGQAEVMQRFMEHQGYSLPGVTAARGIRRGGRRLYYKDRAGIQLPPTTPRPHQSGARTSALAAKAAQGKGPPSSIDWRGRERITNYRSQS